MTDAERERLSGQLRELYVAITWYSDRDAQRELLAEARAIVDRPC